MDQKSTSYFYLFSAVQTDDKTTYLSSFAYLGNSEGGTPVVFENVKTYDSLGVHVAVVNSCSEGHFWWLEGILGGEMDVKKEDSALIGGTRGS